jgi:Major Facilitator Superfamily
MASSFTRNAVVLGLLSAVGPFAIDMYLPALPAIAADLHATTSTTQMTLIAFFVSFGLCQIVYGPLSDVYGRKLPLYGGLTLFICQVSRWLENLSQKVLSVTLVHYERVIIGRSDPDAYSITPNARTCFSLRNGGDFCVRDLTETTHLIIPWSARRRRDYLQRITVAPFDL